MSDDKYGFSNSELSRGLTETAYRNRDIGGQMASSLRYSSPWPWMRAIMISLLLWAGIAALIWRLF